MPFPRRNSRSSSSNNNNKRPLRILCLHDANSDASFLQSKLAKLGDRLWENHAVELVYVNAPLVVDNSDGGDSRAWWQAAADDEATMNRQQYLGLDASLLLVKQMWMSSDFWGIIGIGQGAALASLLTLWLVEENDNDDAMTSRRAPPQCAIFVHGYTVLPEDIPLVSIQRLQSLHILAATTNAIQGSNSIDNKCCPIDLSATARLVTQMGGQTRICQVGEPWYSLECLNCMGRYIVQQKLSSSSRAVTTVQHALSQAQDQAAALVQAHAMQNPPPSLMAVIGPATSHVSGWSGPKRTAPVGGAPCPADFVLPRHKRTTTLLHDNEEQTTPPDAENHINHHD